MKRILTFTAMLMAFSTLAFSGNSEKFNKASEHIEGTGGVDKLYTPSWPGGGGFTTKKLTIFATTTGAATSHTISLSIYLLNGRTGGATQATADDSVVISRRFGSTLEDPGNVELTHYGPFSDQMLITVSGSVVWHANAWGD